MPRRALAILAAAFVVAFWFVLARIGAHDGALLARTTDRPIALREGSVELLRAHVPAGRAAVFEVCSRALLQGDALVGHVVFEVVDAARHTTEVSVPLDAQALARVRRGRQFGCLVLARAARLAHEVDARLVARLDGSPLPQVPFAGHVVARLPLGPLDFVAAFVPALLALGAVVLLARRARGEVAAPAPGDSPMRTLVVALGCLALGFVASTYLPLGGARGGLARGLVLIAAQLAAVAFVVRQAGAPAARGALGLRLPASPARAFAAALALGLGLRLASAALLRLLPSAGTAAVERLVSPSSGVDVPQTLFDAFSGLLAFASVAVVAPVVEELFFRGVLYGALERARGARVAATTTAVLFVLPHAAQTGGAPAALLSIALLSIVATLARATTGSVVVPVIIHFVHNALVALLALGSNLR